MGRIREFRKEDIAAVAEGWLKIFRRRQPPVPRALQDYFEEMFFGNPWRDLELPSLVYEEGGQGIVGFLGVLPRRMVFQGRPVRVAVGTQFYVDSGRHRGMAALELIKRFFAGPQDLALTDGAEPTSQKLWEAARGDVALLYSMDWVRVLRPARHALELVRGRSSLLGPLAALARPVCQVADALVARVPRGPYKLPAPQGVESEASAQTLLDCIRESAGKRPLGPEYDLDSLTWLLERAAEAKQRGELKRRVVRDGRGNVLGWYFHYLKPGGVGQVLQLGGRDVGEVLKHLFYRAWKGGAVAVTGQLEPKLARALTDHQCFFTCLSLGVLVQSRHKELMDAIHRGDAFLTRLEGEWWMRFESDPWN